MEISSHPESHGRTRAAPSLYSRLGLPRFRPRAFASVDRRLQAPLEGKAIEGPQDGLGQAEQLDQHGAV